MMIIAQQENSAEMEKCRIVHLIRRWGGSASDALLDPSCKYYMLPDAEGLIGYRMNNNTLVALGDPVCPPEHLERLTSGMSSFAKGQGCNLIYMMASEPFAKWSLGKISHAYVQFGDEFFIDPHDDPRQRSGTHGSLVRRKVRHAQGEGTTVEEYTSGNDIALENAITEAGKHWLEGRRGPQIHISNVYLFDDRYGKRWFYARQGGRIVGTAVLNRLEKNNGWLLNHIMFTPDAPHGTPEYLVVTALEAAAKSGSHFVTFGSSPSSKLGETAGLSPLSNWTAHLLFSAANKFFHLEGHKTFWDKFHPESRGSYLLFSKSHIAISDLLALKHTLNVSL